MHLKSGTLLQGGKYRIESMLGQGGFGITYLATQDILDRKVAIKEFFFKEYCEREGDTNTITLGTQSNKATVERFLKKFIKEAKTISSLHHPNIIQIHDIFRENNTAYYVMEFIDGVSLGEMVKTKGALPESVAVEYIKKTADALSYIHARNINHLDVKPNNIMLRNSDGEIVLIDFGVAKQYDETTKEGTTTTPVGISHGYSPSEQYKRNGVSSFSPESDIYSLGATLYKLVTGITPPEAIEVAQEGLPPISSTISEACQATIKRSMKLNKADRPHNIAEFVEILTPQIKEPEIIVEVIKEETVIPSITQNQEKPQTSVAESKKNERISNNSSNERTSRNQQDAKSNKEIKNPQEPHVSGKIGGGKPRPLNKLNVGISIVTLITIVPVGIYMKQALGGARTHPIAIQRPDSTSVEKSESKDYNGKVNEPQEQTTGYENGHEWVDLGLSVKWATCNIGANNPEDYGAYYAWGESQSKKRYDLTNYSPTKSHNTAKENWSGKWRLPTKEEIQELCKRCTWKWTCINGHNGYKIVGPSGKSIFLPAAGLRFDSKSDLIGEYGLYWCDTQSSGVNAPNLNFNSLGTGIYYNGREDGRSVRPVTP